MSCVAPVVDAAGDRDPGKQLSARVLYRVLTMPPNLVSRRVAGIADRLFRDVSRRSEEKRAYRFHLALPSNETPETFR